MTRENFELVGIAKDHKLSNLLERVSTRLGMSFALNHEFEEYFVSTTASEDPPAVFLVEQALFESQEGNVVDLLRRAGHESPVVVLARNGTADDAVRALRLGAFDFVVWANGDEERIREATTRALEKSRQRSERESGTQLIDPSSRPILLGSSPQVRAVRDLIDAVADKNATVLITGETGSGKEVAARMIHERSVRSEGKFVPINCGALSPTVLESELFGHTKGAFTGATQARPGLLVTASGGTLFLDEVSELDFPMQVRLLRVLQESEVRAVGSDKSRAIDTRVVAATNRPLSEMVKRGLFREDLYYRLNVFEILMPPLRQRRADIKILVDSFLRKFSARFGRKIPRLGEGILAELVQYDWPGNVRQLENVLARALILCGDTLEVRHLNFGQDNSEAVRRTESSSQVRLHKNELDTDEPIGPLRTERDRFEKTYLVSLLRYTNNNRALAARVAELDPSNLRRLLKRHGLL